MRINIKRARVENVEVGNGGAGGGGGAIDITHKRRESVLFKIFTV